MRPLLVTLLVAGCVIGATTASACLWGHEARRTTQQLPEDIFKLPTHVASDPLALELPLPSGNTKIEAKKTPRDNREQFRQIIKLYEVKPRSKLSLVQREDFAVALIFDGRYGDAISELHALESEHPGRYETAANLGTAYELAGEPENALTWIKKGIERNADSHAGTEWLHVAILETKLKLIENPHWLETNPVIEGHHHRSRGELEKAFEYQLNERLNFIQENDPIMCDLFYQAALTSSDGRKRTYFLLQVRRFGSIRDKELSEL